MSAVPFLHRMDKTRQAIRAPHQHWKAAAQILHNHQQSKTQTCEPGVSVLSRTDFRVTRISVRLYLVRVHPAYDRSSHYDRHEGNSTARRYQIDVLLYLRKVWILIRWDRCQACVHIGDRRRGRPLEVRGPCKQPERRRYSWVFLSYQCRTDTRDVQSKT